MADAAVAAETVVDEAEVAAVNATFICTREMLASHGTIMTRGTVPTVEVEIMGEGDTTSLRAFITLLQTKPRAIRTEGTHPKTITHTTNRAATEDRPSRRMTRDHHINRHPMEVVEEGTIPDTMARRAPQRMGTLEGEVVLLPIGEVRRITAGGMEIKEIREGDMDMVATVADTTSPRKTPVTAEVVTVEVVVINLVEVTSPVDHTVLVSSLTGTEEDTTKEVVVVGEGTDHPDRHTNILLRFASSVFSSCFEPISFSMPVGSPS